MKKNKYIRQNKENPKGLYILLWGIIFTFVFVLLMVLFAVGGATTLFEIFGDKNYWLSNGVVDGLIVAGFLLVYRVDAQNIALKQNDLEDTDWLTVKKLKKMKEFKVFDFKNAAEANDGIVIGAEKKGKNRNVNFFVEILLIMC